MKKTALLIIGLLVIVLSVGCAGKAHIDDGKIVHSGSFSFVFYDKAILTNYTYAVVRLGKSNYRFNEAQFDSYILKGSFYLWVDGKATDDWHRLDLDKEYFIYVGYREGIYLLSTTDLIKELTK